MFHFIFSMAPTCRLMRTSTQLLTTSSRVIQVTGQKLKEQYRKKFKPGPGGWPQPHYITQRHTTPHYTTPRYTTPHDPGSCRGMVTPPPSPSSPSAGTSCVPPRARCASSHPLLSSFKFLLFYFLLSPLCLFVSSFPLLSYRVVN